MITLPIWIWLAVVIIHGAFRAQREVLLSHYHCPVVAEIVRIEYPVITIGASHHLTEELLLGASMPPEDVIEMVKRDCVYQMVDEIYKCTKFTIDQSFTFPETIEIRARLLVARKK